MPGIIFATSRCTCLIWRCRPYFNRRGPQRAFHPRPAGGCPPGSKFYALTEAEPLFKASWEMKRKFPSSKDSGSEYDLSLAVFALQANWSWQETVNLLIAFRREWAEAEDGDQGRSRNAVAGGYYSRTLSMAQKGAGASRGRERRLS
jgi:hypothetical protein